MDKNTNSEINNEENVIDEIDYDIFNRTPDRTQTERAENKKKSSKKSRIIKAIFIITAAAVLITAAVLICPLLSTKHNPDRFIRAYVESIIDKDWESVYKSSAFGSSPFVSYEAFEKFCSENPAGFALCDRPVSDFTIETDKKDGSAVYYSVHFVDTDGNVGVYYIELDKTKDGFWLYDKYSAVPSENSMCSATVYAPCSTVITVDGIELEKTQTVTDKSKLQSGEVTFDEYKIDHIFEGEHEIKAVNQYCDEYTETISISKTQSKHYIALTVSESCFDGLLNSAAQSVQALYNGALADNADKNSIGLSPSFPDSKLSSLVSDIRSAAYCDSRYLTISDISISNPSMAGEYEKTQLICGSDEAICIPFSFDYKYKITNSAEGTSEERSDSGHASAYFTYENGQWLISDITAYTYF